MLIINRGNVVGEMATVAQPATSRPRDRRLPSSFPSPLPPLLYAADRVETRHRSRERPLVIITVFEDSFPPLSFQLSHARTRRRFIGSCRVVVRRRAVKQEVGVARSVARSSLRL